MRNLSPQRSPNQETLQDQAKAAYQTGDFEEALKLYRTALSSDARDKKERQLLLSNIVACRLNIGGKAQAEAAVENAKQVSILARLGVFFDILILDHLKQFLAF